jgi:hypothetical protein
MSVQLAITLLGGTCALMTLAVVMTVLVLVVVFLVVVLLLLSPEA